MARRHEMSQVLEGVQDHGRPPPRTRRGQTKAATQKQTQKFKNSLYADTGPIKIRYQCHPAQTLFDVKPRREEEAILIYICLVDLVNYCAVSGHAGLRLHDIIQVLRLLSF